MSLLRNSASLILLFLAFDCSAKIIPIPTQEQWVHAKKKIHLDNGINLSYIEAGNTDGKPLLFIHGYTDSSRTWSLIMPYLKNRHVYAIDLRGHGQSDAPVCCYAYTDLASDANLFLKKLKIAKADVVGHSLGSLTTQVLATAYPERVNKVVLMSSTLNIGINGPGNWLWDNIHPLQAPIDPHGKFMQEWRWNPNPIDSKLEEILSQESAVVPLHVWKGVLSGAMYGDLSNAAKLMSAPMLILWGDQDQLLGADHQKKLQAAYPKAKFIAFKNVGHNINLEKPKQTAELIEDFLNTR